MNGFQIVIATTVVSTPLSKNENTHSKPRVHIYFFRETTLNEKLH